MSRSYVEKYPVGTTVRISTHAELATFRSEWTLHNPLETAQLAWADRIAVVAEVGFYHGGDVLYRLADVPGVWHEVTLRAIAPAT